MSLPTLPAPDTHCFDDDTGVECWSHSPAQMQAYGQQCRAKALDETYGRVCSADERQK